MRLGLALPQFGAHSGADQITSFARTGEQLGYGSLWVADRLLIPVTPSGDSVEGAPQGPYPPQFRSALDPIVVLAAAAAATTTVQLGSCTLNAPWHNALLLARSLTSLDRLCGGRLNVGLGTGRLREEYTATGTPWHHRGSRLEEMLDVWHELWTHNPAEYHGRHFELPLAHIDLRPVQPGGPPVLLGGWSPAALTRIGRRAAGWLPVHEMPADLAAQLWQTARHAAEEAGRDPDLLRRELRINLQPGQDAGYAADVVAQARDSGIDGAFLDLQYVTSSVEESLSLAAEMIAKVGALD